VIRQPRGKTLGGSGAINGHIYNRGHRLDFDDWAARGNPGWDYASVLPFFRRSENAVGINAPNDFHGTDGLFTVTDIDQRNPLCDAFIEGAQSIGIAHNPDYNGSQQDGIAYAQRSIHRGRRVSPSRSFLSPAIKRGNTDVRTEAMVERILFEGRTAKGVRYRHGNEVVDVFARREVIICGGAIASPQILQISGVGEARHLNDIGADLVHALPGVGENFRDHYNARLVSRVNVQTVNERVQGLAMAREVIRYALTRRGALAMTPTLVYAFIKSSPDLDRSDIQVTFTPASYPAGVQSLLDDFPGVTVACWQQQPKSSGFIRARSTDPNEHPEIQPNYLSHPDDREGLLKAMRMGRRLLNTEAFSEFVVHEERPGDTHTSDEQLLQYAAENGNSSYHPIGTCRMGPAESRDSVVDAALKVHGIDRLRVADASIMPDMLCANTNAASLMIGEKAADAVLAK